MPTLHVVIPFYNEQDTLEACLARVLAVPLPDGWVRNIVLVDDHSNMAASASAREVVERAHRAGHPVTLLRHEINRGKGAAVRTGFDHVLTTRNVHGDPSTDAVIIQDADLEYDPADFSALLDPIRRGAAEAVFGTRWGTHRVVRGLRPVLHRLGNRTLTWISNRLTGLAVRDMECCYKVLTVPLLARVRPHLTEDRFGIEPQIAAAIARTGCRIAEVPVSYDPRGISEGKKIRMRDGVEALRVIWRERRPPRGRRPESVTS